jgi:AbrB family looped-hinge helix DNA binding protein
MLTTAKITKKGQVTIPKKIRERLKSNVIEFDIVENNVVIRPIKSVAGSLSSYAKHVIIPFREAREQAWDKAVKEKYGKKIDRR